MMTKKTTNIVNEKKEEVKNTAVVETVKNKSVATTVAPLTDSDEIEMVSLIPNVSYADKKTGDMYKWASIGDTEIMTMETIKEMWKNHKDYLRKFYLKPNDERVIAYFKLNKLYEEYSFIFTSDYNKTNIKSICETISKSDNSLRLVIINKIRNLIESESLTDITVIRQLESCLKIKFYD